MSLQPTDVDPRTLVDPEVLKAAVDRELAERLDRAMTATVERKDLAQTRPPLPRVGVYRALSSGKVKRRSRPVAKVEDRQFVPGVLRHWRMVHGGISMTEAQVRIGYSPNSSTWRQWEDGVGAPPYLALLKILGATGLGYWTETGLPQEGTLGEVRLALLNTEHRQLRENRRRARRTRRTERRAES